MKQPPKTLATSRWTRSSDAARLVTLCDSDAVAAATLQCIASRLQRCDPAMLGCYAEHLVAMSIGSAVVGDGWGPVDIFWSPGEGSLPVGIQVKAARVHRTFGPGPERTVKFRTEASKTLEGVWRRDGIEASRAPIWVLAVHAGLNHDDDWRFFVVPGKFFDTRNKSSITLRTLMRQVGLPIRACQLQQKIAELYDQAIAGSGSATRDLNKSANRLATPASANRSTVPNGAASIPTLLSLF